VRGAKKLPRRSAHAYFQSMDRSRRQGPSARPATAPPPSSRLTVRKKNRRRPGSVWSRLPRPGVIADACGRALRRALPAMIAVVALGVAAGTVWGCYRWVTTSPRFAIAAIEIRGNTHVPDGELRARVPLRLGDNVFADLAAVARAARSHPWVASAEVHRILPNTITIDIREHVAAAVLELGDRYLVDATGLPFKRAEDGEGEGLPTITGLERAPYVAEPAAAAATVRAALDAFARWRSSDRPAIDEIHVDPHGALTLHTTAQASRIAIQLGALDDALAARIRAFDAAWAGLGDAERARARAIHVGARPDHATVAFAKDAN
jgi:cell division protein FtsQ